MKMHTLLLSALVSATAFAASGTASATTVDFSGSDNDMHLVAYGQSGTISSFYYTNPSPDPVFLEAFGANKGILPSMSKITFSYTMNGMVSTVVDGLVGKIGGMGSYNFTGVGPEGTGHYTGISVSVSDLGSFNDGKFNGAAATPLLLSTAALNIDPTLTTGSITFINNSSNIASFNNAIAAVLLSSGNSGTLTYNVSAVPLPASLSLFLTVIVGMAGFSRFARQRQYANQAA